MTSWSKAHENSAPQPRLSDEETWQIDNFFSSLPEGPKILVETDFHYNQSHWRDHYAFDMLAELHEADPVFIFAASEKPVIFKRFAEQCPKAVWCSHTVRMTAELYNRCDAFIGVGSEITQVTTSDCCRVDIPRVEVVQGEQWSSARFPHIQNLRVCLNHHRFREALMALAVNLQGRAGSPDFSSRFGVIDITADRIEKVPCPSCGSTQAKAVRSADIVECLDCELAYLRDRPKTRAMEAAYKKLYAVDQDDAAAPVRLPPSIEAIDTEPEFIGAQRQYLLDILSKVCGGELAGKQLIDIGCGWGALLYNARRRGMQVLGFEFTEPNVEFGRSALGLDIRQEQFNTADLTEGSADAVIMSHSLEHVPYPFEFLEKIQYTLKRDGVFLCVVPNFGSICSQVLRGKWSWLDRPWHCTYFTPQSLRDMLIQTGFYIDRCETSSGDFGRETPLAVLKNLHNESDPEKLERLLEEAESKGMGEEIRIVSRKRGPSIYRVPVVDAPKRVLWVRPDAIGDAVLSAAMLPAVKVKYQKSEITVLCQEHISELYETDPNVDSIITFNRSMAMGDAAYRSKLAEELASLQADLTLNSVYSREALADFFAIASKGSEIIGFNGDLCNISESDRERTNQSYTRLIIQSKENLPELERHREFLTALDITAASLQPTVWLTEEDERAADEIFERNGFDQEKTIGLFIGAQNAVRLYPHYGRALSRFCSRHRLQVMAFGSNAESSMNTDCLNQIGSDTANLCGRTTLRQTAALLKRCRLAIGAETGTAHVACAVGTPHVIVVGGGHFARFLPYSALTTLVCLPLECYGCNWRCHYTKAHCIQSLAPEVLETALNSTWDSPGHGPKVFAQHREQWPATDRRPHWQWPPDGRQLNGCEVHFIKSLANSLSSNHSDNGFRADDQTLTTNRSLKFKSENPEKIEANRAGLAKSIWRTQAAALPKLMLGETGASYRRLMSRENKALPIIGDDWQVTDLMRTDPAGGNQADKKLKQLIVSMLYLHPHQLPFEVALDQVPCWFREDYFRFLLSKPELFLLPGETEQYRHLIESLVSALHHNLLARPGDPVWQRLAEIFMREADFIPVYFSRANPAELYRKRAAITENILDQKLGMRNLEFLPPPAKRRRIRLGIYLTAVAPHTETYATIPIFEHLNQDEFEVYLYVQKETHHPIETAVRRRVGHFQILPETVKQSVQAIRADDLDIMLFGCNLSANQGFGYMLACHRLARRQGIHFCNPVSSGLSHVDFFLLGEYTAPKGPVADQYSEAVIKLDGSGICFDLLTENTKADNPVARKALGIGESAVVFISGANFFKLTPELQRNWARLLAVVPDSRLVLYPFGPAWSSRYPKEALTGAIENVLSERGLDRNRLIMVDTMKDRCDVLGLLQAADVYLDAWPYNGATSLIDPLQIGLPTVVLAGDQLRFSQGAAVLRDLGLDELVTHSETAYTRLAVNLGQDQNLRDALRSKIMERMQAGPLFLDPLQYAGQVGRAFKRMCFEDTGQKRWAV